MLDTLEDRFTLRKILFHTQESHDSRSGGSCFTLWRIALDTGEFHAVENHVSHSGES